MLQEETLFIIKMHNEWYKQMQKIVKQTTG